MKSEKILIIDDEEYDRKALIISLKKTGYSNIESADAGKCGIEKLRCFYPDIIIIDVVLPDMDGFDVCTQIRSQGYNDPKIIMITGHMDKVNARKAVVSGANEIVEKEPGFGSVCKTIEKLLQG